MTSDADSSLSGTPYLIPSDSGAVSRLEIVKNRSINSRTKAIEVQGRIQREADDLLQPYLAAIRADLVAESNMIEGYQWSAEQVREVVTTHRELLNQPTATIVESVRSDPRVFEALGLYKAHEIADSWADQGSTPRQFEVRALHSLITAGEHYAGKYKSGDNEIGGTTLRTTPHWDTQRAMGELCDWWSATDADPALIATVVHAWLTHIHPFEDGNGRMARLLANMALAQNSYPPLLVRSSADRGQYYDCLAASDEGDILPLYDLFVQILRRTVRSMSAPNYIRDIVQGRLLTSWQNRLAMWKPLASAFMGTLNHELSAAGWSCTEQGFPDVRSFSLLADLHAEGNSWFLKVLNDSHHAEWLLWFGFNSNLYCEAMGKKSEYPSIFPSVKDPSRASVHKFLYVPANDGRFPDEIVIRPLESKPCIIRCGSVIRELSIDDAAKYVAERLAL